MPAAALGAVTADEAGPGAAVVTSDPPIARSRCRFATLGRLEQATTPSNPCRPTKSRRPSPARLLSVRRDHAGVDQAPVEAQDLPAPGACVVAALALRHQPQALAMRVREREPGEVEDHASEVG